MRVIAKDLDDTCISCEGWVLFTPLILVLPNSSDYFIIVANISD